MNAPIVVPSVAAPVLPDPTANLLQLIILLGFAVAVFLVLRPSLKETLDALLRLPAGTTFYLRALLVAVALLALKEALSPIELKQGASFMEYVWAEASALSGVQGGLYGIVIIYVALVTVLALVLRGRRVE